MIVLTTGRDALARLMTLDAGPAHGASGRHRWFITTATTDHKGHEESEPASTARGPQAGQPPTSHAP